VRVGKKVSQKTLLNLGRHFDVEREVWPELCTRIEQILAGESALFELPVGLEQEAQSICAKIVALRGDRLDVEVDEGTDFREIDVNSVELIRPRSVGTEHVSLHALEQLGLPKILEDTGFNGPQQAAALANIIGRMCEPRSGFVRRSEVFEGSVSEGKTLQGMLEKLDAPQGAQVVMDAGIASEEHIEWLSAQGF
jgi:hypothetical protein